MRWLHVHPRYIVDETLWNVVRCARRWEDGVLPHAGGVQDQPQWLVAAIEIVLRAWGKLRAAELDRRGKG